MRPGALGLGCASAPSGNNESSFWILALGSWNGLIESQSVYIAISPMPSKSSHPVALQIPSPTLLLIQSVLGFDPRCTGDTWTCGSDASECSRSTLYPIATSFTGLYAGLSSMVRAFWWALAEFLQSCVRDRGAYVPPGPHEPRGVNVARSEALIVGEEGGEWGRGEGALTRPTHGLKKIRYHVCLPMGQHRWGRQGTAQHGW